MEPTLAVDKAEIDAAVGVYLGYGRGLPYAEVAFDRYQAAAIKDALRSGERRVYYTDVMPGSLNAHNWSFLRPVVTLTLESGAFRLPLPDDCTAGLEGPIYVVDSDKIVGPIQLTGEVRRLRADETTATTGVPQYAMMETVPRSGSQRGTRYQLVFYPTADAAYSIQVSYYVQPDALTDDRPFPYGGPAHAETFIAAAVAAAELQRDGIQGPRHAYYEQCLRKSIALDRRNKPAHFAYNGDRSDEIDPYRRRQLDSGYTVTFDGVTPS